jgi:hypothetical protein
MAEKDADKAVEIAQRCYPDKDVVENPSPFNKRGDALFEFVTREARDMRDPGKGLRDNLMLMAHAIHRGAGDLLDTEKAIIAKAEEQRDG